MRASVLPGVESKYFHLHQLEEGIYAAVVIGGTGAQGNAGIVDLGDRTLVFDTFLVPPAAEDLRDAAHSLTGRPVDWVINSHEHFDHHASPASPRRMGCSPRISDEFRASLWEKRRPSMNPPAAS
jgi:Metallo-beta-lactamase superfamily